MGRVITILEVSQKQAYIFGSNKLRDNITNSAVIAYALSPEYISSRLSGAGYSDDVNMVYAGGGHTILVFSDKDAEITGRFTSAFGMAKGCTQILTEAIYRDFDGLTVFAMTIPYNEELGVKENLKNLTSELEAKKAIRRAAFKKGSFGIEKESLAKESDEKTGVRKRELEKALPENIIESGYKAALQFENLGGSKNESNFIAIVHIDGNGMGKRVEELYDKGRIDNRDFDTARKALREFSDCIDSDFKGSFDEMLKTVQREIEENKEITDALSIKADDNGVKYFPVRKVITAGDDICFVSEGRLGIECAVKFIEALNKRKNSVDGEGYSACAGVAIVHQKYPFYKAYELAEMLCSNAKGFNATIHESDNGQSLSSIDWHIEFGELGDSIEEIRDNYISGDGERLNMRPYIINGLEKVDGDVGIYHSYKKFVERFKNLNNSDAGLASGKLKGLRNAIREGMDETAFYLTSNIMDGVILPEIEFIKDYDGREVSVSFDAIELMDTYLPFKA